MRRDRKILWIALAAFVASFFLPAIHERTVVGDVQGYFCAWITIAYPWASGAMQELRANPVEFTAIVVSGLINPVFLITLASLERNKNKKAGETLRIVVLCMFPACWVVLFMNHYYPKAGYFLWASAMLVALFSKRLSELRFRQSLTKQVQSVGLMH